MFRRSVARRFTPLGGDPPGRVHPDVSQAYGGLNNLNYLGRGWSIKHKRLPQEFMLQHFSQNFNQYNDDFGYVQDPEDPRHPTMREIKNFDDYQQERIMTLMTASFGPIQEKSRLLQVLYNNYLEPYVMHRNTVTLENMGRGDPYTTSQGTIGPICASSSMIGDVNVSLNGAIDAHVVVKGDTNSVFIGGATYIGDNVCIIADAPATLHHYQRGERFNPYQTFETTEGTVFIADHVVIEANCTIESCMIEYTAVINHNVKIHKGCSIGIGATVLPGSVVAAGTKIGEYEIWGGAPARKVGKAHKSELKFPYEYARYLYTQAHEQLTDYSLYGDEFVHQMEKEDQLTSLAIEYQQKLSPSVKNQVKEAYNGKEDYIVAMSRVCMHAQDMVRDEAGNRSDIMKPTESAMAAQKGSWEAVNNQKPNDPVGSPIYNLTDIAHNMRW